MLGIFAGGWKFGGYPGLPCWLLSICCMPGAAPVPGAAMPGGAGGRVSDVLVWAEGEGYLLT